MGTRYQLKRIKGDVFACPVCRTHQSYYELYREKYYTVFFLPTVAIDDPEETGMIECCGCGTQFQETATYGHSSKLAPYDKQKPVAHDKYEDLQTTLPCPNCGRENSAHARVCPRCEA